jgi:hypothetical protein
MSNIFTVITAYPMQKRPGTPLGQAAGGYGAYRLASILGTLAVTAVTATPAIVAAVLTSTAPEAIRAPLLLVGSAAYGVALIWAGVRIAAMAAEHKLPELCQVALASQM